jgi:hypothetical protein
MSVRSPWQNGVAERLVGTIRRQMLDHVIALNERHLMRLSLEYVRYYQDDRTHLRLNKETPGGRSPKCDLICTARSGQSRESAVFIIATRGQQRRKRRAKFRSPVRCPCGFTLLLDSKTSQCTDQLPLRYSNASHDHLFTPKDRASNWHECSFDERQDWPARLAYRFTLSTLRPRTSQRNLGNR